MKSRLTIVAGHAVLSIAGFITIYPLLWVVKMALSRFESVALGLAPWPSHPTLDNFRRLLGAHDLAGRWLFGRQLAASLAVASVTTVAAVALAAPAAYALARYEFPGRRSGARFLLLTQMFPGVVLAIPLYLLLDALRLAGTLTGLALVYSTTALPFCVFMLQGYVASLPRELEDAARVDGASEAAILLRVVLPLCRPALAVTALFAFMTAWNEFILAATFLSDETRFTLPVALQRHVGEFSTDWGQFAAGAVLVSLPVMALFLALERHLVRGLTAGAVKG